MTHSSKASIFSPGKRALIEAMLRENGIKASQRAPMRAVSREADLPLSYAQERLWFLDQLMSGSAVYNIPASIRFTGRLDVAALDRSILEIARRHEVLRTGFRAVDGQPVKVISPDVNLSLRIIDLGFVAETERECKAQQLASEEARRPFDLAQSPLLRASLLRLADQDHILLLTAHHIISDGWSMSVLFRELTALYDAYSKQEASPLADLPVQYADYAVWQREWLQGEVLEAQLSYWRKQLGGDLPLLELPTDRPRPAVQSYRGARQTLALSANLSRALKRRASEQRATLFMILLAAFKTLLHRYTGQSDLMIGTPIANRNRVEVEGLIGFFANTLVLRTDLSGDPTFTELIRRVREVTLGAYDHQDVPFEKLVEELHVERDLSHTPLAQAMFALNNDPMRALELPGLSLSPLAIDSGTAKLDITLTIVESAQGLTAALEYNTDLFDASTISRMLRHFERVLEEAVINPNRRLSEFSLLTERERNQLLFEWNDTKLDYPKTACIHELFEAQAARAPEAIAVEFEDRRLTYAELNSRANQLASYLRKMRVGPETLVAIAIDRSIEMVVGLLGILKSGAAYVPLNTEYPKERLAAMLEDAAPLVLLTEARFADGLPETCANVVCIDNERDQIAAESKENIAGGASAGNLAYVMYTSGSTGKPKGVQIEHRAVVNFLTAMRREPGLCDQDALLAVTTLSFDIAGLELYLPLTTGARVIIASRELVADPSLLIGRIEAAGATVMQATPATWKMLIDSDWQGSANLKVLCGGEALATDLAREIASRSAQLWNMYGPTETTIWSAVCELDRAPKSISIGKPIANTQLYLLDEKLNPAPIGVGGELYIGGDGLSRGYVNRPELTAEKFVPDPFSDQPGARFYRTGDLARYLPDGRIEFLCRLDHQVKLRGFRIELGEIETALGEFAEVRESVVVAREDARGEKQLVAYLVADSNRAISISRLRSALKERLPEFMVPSAFVLLDEMPLTPNGKLNRRALPAPDSSAVDSKVSYVAPCNEMEQSIAVIWKELLGIERVGMNDNFFDLGGNSLLMVRARSRVRSLVDRDIEMVEMFRHPTIGALVAYLTQGQREEISFEQSTDRAANRRKALQRQREMRQAR